MENQSVKIPLPAQTAIEKISIAAASILYLMAFFRTLPHGDALRIVRQIEQSHLVWNPNHLLFDPLGYYIYALMSWSGIEITTLGSFSLISGTATVISLLIFHSILLRAGIKLLSVRILGTAGVWASQSFLSQSTSQYYMMVQMPFLLGALYFYIDYVSCAGSGQVDHRNLYWIGLLLAISATIMFNNLLLIPVAGIAVGLQEKSPRRWQIGLSLRLWGAAAALGVPVFIAGYLLSGKESGFFVWLLSYGGDAASKLNSLYGIKWTLSGVTEATAMVVFNTVLGSILSTAGLGTLIKVFVFGSSMEFIPNYGLIVSNLLLAPAVIILCVGTGYYAIRNVRRGPTRFLASWIGAFLFFNFLWNAGDDIFWFQIIPAIWLLALMSQGVMTGMVPTCECTTPSSGKRNWRWYGLVALVPLLFIVNTRAVVLPASGSEFSRKQDQHEAILRSGDLEIIPGWDQQKWMLLSDRAPNVRRIVLMNAVLAPDESPLSIRMLHEIVEGHLRSGGRVIVARLYDPDQDLMPWYALSHLGWPRKSIQGLLESYCNRPIAEIEGVKFRQLFACSEKPVTRRDQTKR
ncbi:MAG: hypothetical protein A2Z26_06890 [Deltaproteobacteria bacterium RBG_16_66_15]|nr:MAG: hypothetical protein A2Z26_06890 [Deltaproteobacteria bacterium RBG_16_66_15]